MEQRSAVGPSSNPAQIISKIRSRVEKSKPHLKGAALDAEILRVAEEIFLKAEANAQRHQGAGKSYPSPSKKDGPIAPTSPTDELQAEQTTEQAQYRDYTITETAPHQSQSKTSRLSATNKAIRNSTRHPVDQEWTSIEGDQRHTGPNESNTARRGRRRGSRGTSASSQDTRSEGSTYYRGSVRGRNSISRHYQTQANHTQSPPSRSGRQHKSWESSYSIQAPSRPKGSGISSPDDDLHASLSSSTSSSSQRRGAWTRNVKPAKSPYQQSRQSEFGPGSLPDVSEASTIRSAASRYETGLGRATTAATVVTEAQPHVGPYRDIYESSGDDSDAASDEMIQDDRHWTGEAEELMNRYKCHFPDCPNSQPARGFKDSRSLKEHKLFAHDVCGVCNLEFLDFQALLAHKQMSDNHIACWQCGKDFHTAAARERHMLHEHPDLKDLDCPGCGVHFSNSAAFVRHVEQNSCRGITEEQFNKARLMITKMKEFAVIEQVDQTEQTTPEPPKEPSALNLENEEDFPGLPGLDLRKDLPPHMRKPQKNEYEAPHKPVPSDRTAANSLIKKLESLSTAGPLTNVAIDPHQKRLLEVYKKMVGSNHEVYTPPMNMDNEPIYQGIPDHPLYNTAVFKNPIGNYNCPHAFCTKPYKSERALDQHLRSPAHRGRHLRCPECCNVFKTADAIVAHMESPSVYCKIRHSTMFKEAMEIASGSFLSAMQDEFGKTKVATQEPNW